MIADNDNPEDDFEAELDRQIADLELAGRRNAWRGGIAKEGRVAGFKPRDEWMASTLYLATRSR